MGSYNQPRPPDQLPQPESQPAPRTNELQEALFQTLHLIYGANGIMRDDVFLAKTRSGHMVFTYADSPLVLDQNKLIAALTNNNNIEVIYFVPDSQGFLHQMLSYRYIGDYVTILAAQSRSDLVRTINEHRNRIEESYERSRKARAAQIEALRSRQNHIR